MNGWGKPAVTKGKTRKAALFKEMEYTDIDSCEVCGEDLQDGRGMHGICEFCEEAKKNTKRAVEG